jgi:hypothetical protein
MVPIIQLEKLSSLTWLFALKSVTIGETVIKCFSYWLFIDIHSRLTVFKLKYHIDCAQNQNKTQKQNKNQMTGSNDGRRGDPACQTA